MPAPARHPPPCGSRERPPRPCALADVVNELEQSVFATPLEPELGEPSERELETEERDPEPGEPSPRADSNGDERTVRARLPTPPSGAPGARRIWSVAGAVNTEAVEAVTAKVHFGQVRRYCQATCVSAHVAVDTARRHVGCAAAATSCRLPQ